MDSIVQLRNIDDLKKVLFLQRTITTQAHNELLAAGEDTGLSDPVESSERIVAEEAKVLAKYAKYPTLTEFQLLPNAYDGYKWGATFGVTLLVGELIFEHIKQNHKDFAPVVRQLFTKFLMELDNPQHEYLSDPLEKLLNIKITTEDGGAVSPEVRKAYTQEIVGGITDTMVTISESFGLVEVKKGGVLITQLGNRVLLHLLDAAKFIEEMTKAHTKFQTTKPQLSMN